MLIQTRSILYRVLYHIPYWLSSWLYRIEYARVGIDTESYSFITWKRKCNRRKLKSLIRGI